MSNIPISSLSPSTLSALKPLIRHKIVAVPTALNISGNISTTASASRSLSTSSGSQSTTASAGRSISTANGSAGNRSTIASARQILSTSSGSQSTTASASRSSSTTSGSEGIQSTTASASRSLSTSSGSQSTTASAGRSISTTNGSAGNRSTIASARQILSTSSGSQSTTASASRSSSTTSGSEGIQSPTAPASRSSSTTSGSEGKKSTIGSGSGSGSEMCGSGSGSGGSTSRTACNRFTATSSISSEFLNLQTVEHTLHQLGYAEAVVQSIKSFSTAVDDINSINFSLLRDMYPTVEEYLKPAVQKPLKQFYSALSNNAFENCLLVSRDVDDLKSRVMVEFRECALVQALLASAEAPDYAWPRFRTKTHPEEAYAHICMVGKESFRRAKKSLHKRLHDFVATTMRNKIYGCATIHKKRKSSHTDNANEVDDDDAAADDDDEDDDDGNNSTDDEHVKTHVKSISTKSTVANSDVDGENADVSDDEEDADDDNDIGADDDCSIDKVTCPHLPVDTKVLMTSRYEFLKVNENTFADRLEPLVTNCPIETHQLTCLLGFCSIELTNFTITQLCILPQIPKPHHICCIIGLEVWMELAHAIALQSIKLSDLRSFSLLVPNKYVTDPQKFATKVLNIVNAPNLDWCCPPAGGFLSIQYGRKDTRYIVVFRKHTSLRAIPTRTASNRKRKARLSAAYSLVKRMLPNGITGGSHPVSFIAAKQLIKRMDVQKGNFCWEIGCGEPRLAFTLSAACLNKVVCTDTGGPLKELKKFCTSWKVLSCETAAYKLLNTLDDATLEDFAKVACSTALTDREAFAKKYFPNLVVDSSASNLTTTDSSSPALGKRPRSTLKNSYYAAESGDEVSSEDAHSDADYGSDAALEDSESSEDDDG